jgi:hypothetical protein
MPAAVRRVRIQGEWNRRGTSNFAVEIRGRLIVNSILRESITYDGTHAVPSGTGPAQTEVTISDNISWTFTEIR